MLAILIWMAVFEVVKYLWLLEVTVLYNLGIIYTYLFIALSTWLTLEFQLVVICCLLLVVYSTRSEMLTFVCVCVCVEVHACEMLKTSNFGSKYIFPRFYLVMEL